MSFTVVLRGDFAVVADVALAWARADARIRVARAPFGQVLYFAGARAVAREGESVGLASLRLSEASRVVHVDLDGYEGSVRHLEPFVRDLMQRCGACKVWDDETGEDLSHLAVSQLFEARVPPEPIPRPLESQRA